MTDRRTNAKLRRPPPSTAISVPVSAVMSRDVITIPSGTSVEAVTELMLSRELARAPVVDAGGRLVGIVSRSDLIQHAHDAGDTQETPERSRDAEELRGFHVHAEGLSVDDVMTRSVTAIGENASLQRAAEMMAGGHIHALPVVTEAGALVGFVSSMDILGWLAGLR